ncbi:MAG TPA: hypothetical protein DCR44_05700 [Acholeplasmatales bacterium]|nr:MAG: hypothetical protein A2Y16_03120 [Tenericutes bacterium GWF2_57_13]HAQ56874.1 hypothetical protein [Acholeplasmatales bacterium]
MKKQYLSEIRTLLGRYVITALEIEDIINDYDRMYEDGLAKGMNDAEVIDFLGKPEKVVRDLGDAYDRKPGKHSHHGKIIALMPFLCVIAYFLIGFVGHAWHPGWLVFLAVPVSAILFGASGRNLMGKLTALSPFIAVVAFIVLGEYGLWNPGWLVFLLIPTIGALNDHSWKGKVFALTLILASAGYLYCGYALNAWGYGALCFLLPLVFGAATGFVDIIVDWKDYKKLPVSQRRFFFAMWFVVLATAATYVILGVAFDWWAYAWLVFLVIPMFPIIAKGGAKNRIVALSPFLATILFFLLGFLVPGAWAYAWIAFLLIPMTAILKNA